MNQKTGILLINLGTPDSPAVKDVRRYLREFLTDGRVLDIPSWKRYLLVNLIIAPLRGPKSAAEYQKLWTDRGSPLKFYGEELAEKLGESLGPNFDVRLAMRYQNPSIEKVLKEIQRAGCEQIIVVPLFPQYASASTGSAVEEFMKVIGSQQVIPKMTVVRDFYDYPKYISSFAEIGKKYLDERKFDHVLFSYHGLPERQIKKVSDYCQLNESCCSSDKGCALGCYRAQCFRTTKLLTEALSLKEGSYTTSFQSRLGKTPWIKPYTDEVITSLADRGIKSVLAFSPSFTADCLETTVEIGETYRDLFLEAGGEHWQLVESLNVHPAWLDCLKDMVLNMGSI